VVDHLAGCDRYISPDLEMLGPGCTPGAGGRALRVLEPVLEPADQIVARLGDGALEELGIGVQEVRR